MWFKINLHDFSVTQDGFQVNEYDGKKLYSSKGLSIRRIAELAEREYGQAIEVDERERVISFGRDFLGHHPLLYAISESHLSISDEVNETVKCFRADGQTLSISESALALYFTAGYVPQGMSAFNEIHVCENAEYYRWAAGKISVIRQFKPVEIDSSSSIESVGACISDGVKRAAAGQDRINVWCSGGLDSSSVVREAYEQQLNAELITLSYGDRILDKYGSGEIPYAEEMAKACKYPLRRATMDDEQFQQFHRIFSNGHISPVIDTCALAKYALASYSDKTVLTGEGGDPIFGGVKNDFMTFSHSQSPNIPLGLLYAISHGRYFEDLDQIFVRGAELKSYVQDFFERWFDRYPGDLIRKLLYINTFEKQGGIIFAESYYPSKRFGIDIRHPLTSLDVYQEAFRIPDNQKYVYPNGKLALLDLYRDRLPWKIVERKKSGTILPIQHYVRRFPPSAFDFTALKDLNIFKESMLDSLSYSQVTANLETPLPKKDALFIYAFITLNSWLTSQSDDRAHLSS